MKVSIPEGIKDVTAFEELKKFIETGDYSYIRPSVKARKLLGRNDLCYCGSGKKFKKCCLSGIQIRSRNWEEGR